MVLRHLNIVMIHRLLIVLGILLPLSVLPGNSYSEDPPAGLMNMDGGGDLFILGIALMQPGGRPGIDSYIARRKKHRRAARQ